LLLAVSALLSSCRSEKPHERRCVDADGQFVDEARCATASRAGDRAAEGDNPGGASGGWDEPAGGGQPSRGGYHFIWIPYGTFGGVGSFAPGYVRSGVGGSQAGAATSGQVSRGGFGATGAAHAGAPAAATAGG
jgi:hypothetical protein